MTPNAIGFLAFSFIGMTLLNRILEGVLIAGADVTVVNQLTIFRTIQIWIFTVPVPNFEFLTVALPRLIKWDYAFFAGNGGIIQYFLYSVTAFVAFGLFVIMIGLLYNLFNRAR